MLTITEKGGGRGISFTDSSTLSIPLWTIDWVPFFFMIKHISALFKSAIGWQLWQRGERGHTTDDNNYQTMQWISFMVSKLPNPKIRMIYVARLGVTCHSLLANALENIGMGWEIQKDLYSWSTLWYYSNMITAKAVQHLFWCQSLEFKNKSNICNHIFPTIS